MAKVNDVAWYFLSKEKERRGNYASNWKLNVLLYYAQGGFLAKFGTPLFEEPIQSGNGGPFVRSVRICYDEFGPKGFMPWEAVQFNENELKLLEKVEDRIARLSEGRLGEITRLYNTPWNLASLFEMETIPCDLLQAYFEEHPLDGWYPRSDDDCPPDWLPEKYMLMYMEDN